MGNLIPNWVVPSNVVAFTTTRQHGYSAPPFDQNNIGLHVGDRLVDVLANRKALVTLSDLPNEPEWLEQKHSNQCIMIDQEAIRTADAAITSSPGRVLVVMTADCLPILLCNHHGDEIAAIHAGWRGLSHGIIENTIAKLQSSPKDMIAWIGPAICSECFEVGEDVCRDVLKNYSFLTHVFKKKGNSPIHDKSNKQSKWTFDLPRAAENILQVSGVCSIYQSAICTLEQKKYFYSYRRESQTGRMGTFIWLKNQS